MFSTSLGVAPPIVSPTETSSTPRSNSLPITSATFSLRILPSYGHIQHVDTYPRTEIPVASAFRTTGPKTSIDSSMPMLMFFLLKVSEADVNTAMRDIPESMARSSPFMLGTRAEYRVPLRASSDATNSPASASCGTHFGWTNDATSISLVPASASKWMNCALSSVGTVSVSFCRPSLGPTSTILTLSTSRLVDRTSVLQRGSNCGIKTSPFIALESDPCRRKHATGRFFPGSLQS